MKSSANKIIRHTPICLIGAGSASLNVSSILRRQPGVLSNQIRIFDKSRIHYYQPGFTCIGGGIMGKEATEKPRDQVFDQRINHTYSNIKMIDPENNLLMTEDEEFFSYDQLIIAAGNLLNFKAVVGAEEALNDEESPVVSIYNQKLALKTIEQAKKFKGGDAIFNIPVMPIKCGGAPHKIAFLLEDLWKKNSIRDQTNIQQNIAGGLVFGQPKYAEAIKKQYEQKNMTYQLFKNLVQIKGKEKVAVFQDIQTKEITEKQFDFLHMVPPQIPPSFIKESGLADQGGYVDVNPFTLQHKKFQNIWSLGDCSNLPTSKTFAAITSQTPVLVKNLLTVWRDKSKYLDANNKYYGYTSCPLLIGGNKLILAEFKYDSVQDETFYSSQEKPSYLFYLLKLYFFPYVYWNFVKKGLWHGRSGIRLTVQ